MTRIAATAAGFGVAAIAMASHLDHHLLTAHMLQHLLLMLVAAPLILYGIPSTPRPPMAVCWIAGSFTVIFWHIPAMFELAMQSRFLHAFQSISFLTAGMLFWIPVFRTSGWSVPVYLFLATIPCDALSAFLAFCGQIVYAPYLRHGGALGLTALEDQELAGAVMWVAVTFAYLLPALVMTARLVSGRRCETAGIEVL
jgi:putative membrane protein